MHQTKEQLTQFPLITFIKPTATLFLTIATTACQTIGPSHHQTQLNVLKHQRSVIEAVMAERNAPEVSNQVAANATLLKSEMHLAAALRSLKESNDRLQEAIKNGDR